jgi:hypothetical protein
MKAEDANKINSTITGKDTGANMSSNNVAGNITDRAANTLFYEPNPHIQLIETICNDVLPNMVRLYDTKRMGNALDRDQFVKLIEQKVERANKSLKVLPAEVQYIYRAKIDHAYAENMDRLHGIPECNTSVFEPKWRSYHSRNSSL